MGGTFGVSPQFVYDMIIWYFGSWESALKSPDGQAVIKHYLPPSFHPPESGFGDAV